MTNGFGDFDFTGFCDYEPETLPAPGSAYLTIEDRCFPLFLTAEWAVVAQVGTTEIERSNLAKASHSQRFIQWWTQLMIKRNKEKLERMGVDVVATFASWGGDPKQLG